ncbi:MAG: site-specific recombinase XerD, partial [Actinomycetia bacterium]|nr:site-specific recombinase XerD [Actinomycetes bacterium]
SFLGRGQLVSLEETLEEQVTPLPQVRQATVGHPHPRTLATLAVRPHRHFDSAAVQGHHKIRLIKVHHLRHTVGSMLKDLKVPARDAQTILGHTRISTTLEIYTNTDEEARRDALTRLHGLLDQGQN